MEIQSDLDTKVKQTKKKKKMEQKDVIRNVGSDKNSGKNHYGEDNEMEIYNEVSKPGKKGKQNKKIKSTKAKTNIKNENDSDKDNHSENEMELYSNNN